MQMLGWFRAEAALSFALKTGECLRVFGYVVGQELEGNKATEFNVLGFVDHSHTTAAQLLNDAVVRDGLADHEWARDSGCNIRDATRQSQRGNTNGAGTGKSSQIKAKHHSVASIRFDSDANKESVRG